MTHNSLYTLLLYLHPKKLLAYSPFHAYTAYRVSLCEVEIGHDMKTSRQDAEAKTIGYRGEHDEKLKTKQR